MRHFITAAFILFTVHAPVKAAEINCAGDKRVVAACYKVYCKLSIRANMRAYLRANDTHQLLVISYKPDRPEFDPPLPPAIQKILTPDANVYGTFRVCPFTSETDKLSTVCIDSASGLVVKNKN